MKRILLLPSLLALSLAAPPAHAHGGAHPAKAEAAAEQTAWGIAGTPAEVGRTVTVVMSDAMRFTPDVVSVQQGETVRFVVTNAGRMLHEMVIGTPAELAKHAALMARFPGMQHDEAYLAHVEPGKSGEIVWHFNRAGTFEFACLVAGHYEAGMRGTLIVNPTEGDGK